MADQNISFENNCNEAIMSNEYIDLIVPYEESLEDEILKFKPECLQIIDNQYAIFHIKLGKRDVFDLLEEFQLSISSIPVVVGPYGKSSLDASGILEIQTNPYVPLRGNGVLIGVIDSGIDYTHKVFKFEDNTTKIISIWDQTIQGKPPIGFVYGTEYTMDQINEALEAEDPFEIVPSKDLSGHGTFIAGAAAGREVIEEDFIGAAPDANLIVVKLKEAKKIVTDFYSIFSHDVPAYESTDLMMGIKYLSEKAVRLGKPVVCIIGLGTNLGSHDESSIMESYIEDFGRVEGQIVVVAAGNEANLGHHYSGELTTVEYRNVEINVPKGEEGFYLNLWSRGPDILSVAITSPTGEYIGRIAPRVTKREEISLVLEKTNITIYNELFEPQSGNQQIFIRLLNPTEGIWTVTVFGDLVVNGRFDIWMNRSGWILEETKFLQPDAYTTITEPGTPDSVITLGGYDHATGALYINSSRGLNREDDMKPDIVAPGVNVYGALPVNVFGYMTGTSVSAAITGGAAALLLEWGFILGNDEQIDTRIALHYFIRGARRDEALNYPNREWGYGELDFLGIFEYFRE